MSIDIKHSSESNQGRITEAEGCGHLKEEKSSSLPEQWGNTSNGKSQGKQREQSEGRADGDVRTKHLPSGNRWGVPRSFLINHVTHTFWWVQATDLFITNACVQGDEKSALKKKTSSSQLINAIWKIIHTRRRDIRPQGLQSGVVIVSLNMSYS